MQLKLHCQSRVGGNAQIKGMKKVSGTRQGEHCGSQL